MTNDEAKAVLLVMQEKTLLDAEHGGTVEYAQALDIALWLLEREDWVQTLINEAGRIYPGGVVEAYDALKAWESARPRPGS